MGLVVIREGPAAGAAAGKPESSGRLPPPKLAMDGRDWRVPGRRSTGGLPRCMGGLAICWYAWREGGGMAGAWE